MNNTALFLLHPGQFFSRIKDGYLRKYILCVLAIFSVIYLYWGFRLVSLTGKPLSLFLFDSKFVDIIFSLFSHFLISITLSGIIYIASEKFNLSVDFTTILLSLLSLEIIAILSLILQLLVMNVSGEVPYPLIWDAVVSFWQVVYLFIAIKSICTRTISKAIIIQGISLVGVFLLLLIVVGAKNMIIGKHSDLVQRGQYYIQTLQFEKAIEEFNAAIIKEPNNAVYHFYLGEAYRNYYLTNLDRKKDLLLSAEQAFIRSLNIDPDYQNARIGLGLLYSSNERYEDALSEFEHVIRVDPDNHKANEEIGKIYLRINKPELARKYFELSSSGNNEPESQGQEYEHTSIDKIRLRDKTYISIESRISWQIVDPVFFNGTIGDVKLGGTRLHDFYFTTLSMFLLEYAYDDVQNIIDDDFKNKIIDECNGSKWFKDSGIEIKRLELSVLDS